MRADLDEVEGGMGGVDGLAELSLRVLEVQRPRRAEAHQLQPPCQYRTPRKRTASKGTRKSGRQRNTLGQDCAPHDTPARTHSGQRTYPCS